MPMLIWSGDDGRERERSSKDDDTNYITTFSVFNDSIMRLG